MELSTRTNIIAGDVLVTFSLPKTDTALSSHERALIRAYGPPLVDFGSSFSNGVISFSLPADVRAIPTAFPVTKAFNMADYTDINQMIELYTYSMRGRISDGIAILLSSDGPRAGTIVADLNPSAASRHNNPSAETAAWMGIDLQ